MIICGIKKCSKPMTSSSSNITLYKTKKSVSKTFVCEECYAKAKEWQKHALPPRYQP